MLFNKHVCSAAALSSSGTHAMTELFFTTVHAAHFSWLPGPRVALPPPVAQCTALLAFLQVRGGPQHAAAGRIAADNAAARRCRTTSLSSSPPPALPPPQLSLGLAAPLLVQAAVEAGLFRQHQAERRTAGLPPITGVAARVYTEIGGLAEALDAVTATMAAWVLAGILWEVAVLVAAGRLQAAA